MVKIGGGNHGVGKQLLRARGVGDAHARRARGGARCEDAGDLRAQAELHAGELGLLGDGAHHRVEATQRVAHALDQVRVAHQRVQRRRRRGFAG